MQHHKEGGEAPRMTRPSGRSKRQGIMKNRAPGTKGRKRAPCNDGGGRQQARAGGQQQRDTVLTGGRHWGVMENGAGRARAVGGKAATVRTALTGRRRWEIMGNGAGRAITVSGRLGTTAAALSMLLICLSHEISYLSRQLKILFFIIFPIIYFTVV